MNSNLTWKNESLKLLNRNFVINWKNYLRFQGFKVSRGRGFKGINKTNMLKNFKDLNVWQKSYTLCIEIYKITKSFPGEEKFCLTSQMRRAAISVPSNIAEGYGRKTIPDYIRSLYIAYGSNCELETQTLLSGDLDYLNKMTKTHSLIK